MLLSLPVVAVLLLVAAWGLDTALNPGKVARNVSVAGVEVGGLDRPALDLKLAAVADSYENTIVIIRTVDGQTETTAGVVGLELDPVTTADTVMEVGRGAMVTRPFSWIGHLFGDSNAEAAVRLGPGNPDLLAATVSADQPEPVEPQVTMGDGEVLLVRGTTVQIFDLSNIREDVLKAARAGANPIEVNAGALELKPERSDEQAQVYVDQFNSLTEAGLEVRAGEQAALFDSGYLRSWMIIEDGEVPTFTLDEDAILVALEETFIPVGPTPDDLVVTVVDGELEVDGFTTQACCAPGSPARILEAVLAGELEVRLETIEIEASQEELLAQIGIVELIGEATTPHNCCQSRVTNIHLIADILRGAIIEPGESLSINEFVGRRTRERGFVESGVIYSGRLTTDVGGGISQFATTIFQAMFYGGLDIDKYQPHTLWFPRYADFEGRRGIESTISFPEPNLQFTNNTPYPVLIWPTYTDTSLTVSLYSTKWTETEVVKQATYGSGHCTVVDTDRLRKYANGTQETDSFRAIYQPGDNIGCDGKPTDPNTVPTPTPDELTTTATG